MATMFSWREVEPAPGEPVAPDERLPWGRTVGIGAQHVVAMFGATFVFPLIMGLNPQLAIMMSGVATIAFLLIVQGKVPSYLGTSASFVGGVAAIRAQGGDSKEVTGAILVAGLVLAVVGVLIHVLGSGVLHKVLPPVVTGYLLLIAFGRRGLFGEWLESIGIVFSFRWTGAALACGIMSFPLLVGAIRLSIEAVDRKLEDAASTLGANRVYLG